MEELRRLESFEVYDEINESEWTGEVIETRSAKLVCGGVTRYRAKLEL